MASGYPPYLIPHAQHLMFASRWSRLLRKGFGVCSFLLSGIVWILAAQLRISAAQRWDLLQRSNPRDDPFGIVVDVLGTWAINGILIILVFCLFVLGLRLMSTGNDQLLLADHRQPVLYLRSFAADVSLTDSWWDLLFGSGESIERALGKTVRPVGPLLAIGLPNERLPPLGAIRLYVDHDRWQQVVVDLVAAASIVILRLGDSEGFWWEFKHVFQTCEPQKVLILLPTRHRDRQYNDFRQRAATISPTLLPTDSAKAFFLTFGPNWVPVLLSKDGPSPDKRLRRWLLFSSLGPYLHEALVQSKPFFLLGRSRLSLREWWSFVLWYAIIFEILIVPQ